MHDAAALSQYQLILPEPDGFFFKKIRIMSRNGDPDRRHAMGIRNGDRGSARPPAWVRTMHMVRTGPSDGGTADCDRPINV
eukprot:SAG31_NODE_31563_length_366_cov_1.606742_1_plen_80_part_01